MQTDEYLKLAEVEDQMWYFRSLHAHVEQQLAAVLNGGNVGELSSPRAVADADAETRGVKAPHQTDTTRKSSMVLDAGCGTGGLILRLRGKHPEWTFSGIDFMPLACDLARKRCGPDVDIRVASIMELPFEDQTFDAVVSADVICQVDNPEVAVAEFFRVVGPGGIVVINVPAYMWMWSYHDDSCQTKHRYTRPEIDALLHGAGFGSRRTTHWNALPFPVVWAKRKLFRTSRDTSDVKLYPAPIEASFNRLMAIEHAWLRAGGCWGWGTSVLGIARKPE